MEATLTFQESKKALREVDRAASQAVKRVNRNLNMSKTIDKKEAKELTKSHKLDINTTRTGRTHLIINLTKREEQLKREAIRRENHPPPLRRLKRVQDQTRKERSTIRRDIPPLPLKKSLMKKREDQNLKRATSTRARKERNLANLLLLNLRRRCLR